jgi:hypothetical protein
MVMVLGAGKAAFAAEKSPFSGYLMFYDYLDLTHPLEEAGFLAQSHPDAKGLSTARGGLRLQLRAANQLQPGLRYDATVNLDYDVAQDSRQPDGAPGDGVSLAFKEGWIGIDRILPLVDLKLGRQYVFWGRFEWGGVVDVVSPWDYGNMSAEKENFRLAVDALRTSVWLDPVNIELLYLPWFIPSRMPLDLPEQVGPLKVLQQPAALPGLGVEDGEVGVRVSAELLDRAEVAATWFWGHQRSFWLSPVVIPDEVTGFPAALEFTPRYSRQHLLALDFEVDLGSVMLLGEGAATFTEDSDGTDVWKKNPSLATVLGVEWDPLSRLSLQVQVAYTRVLNWDRQFEYDTRSAFGEPDPFIPSRDQYQFTWRAKTRVVSELYFQALQLVNRHDPETYDFMALGFFSWEPLEELKIYTGAIVFRGSESIGFGRLENQARYFLELRHYF